MTGTIIIIIGILIMMTDTLVIMTQTIIIITGTLIIMTGTIIKSTQICGIIILTTHFRGHYTGLGKNNLRSFKLPCGLAESMTEIGEDGRKDEGERGRQRKR